MIQKNNKGFSLIEVMTVVGIIAVVSLIAIPNYQRFNAKAKQANAKAELASLYGMETAFQQEFGGYHNNVHYIGYTPDGYPMTSSCPNAVANTATTTGPIRYYRTGFGGTELLPVSGAPTIPCPGSLSYAATTNAQAIASSAAVTDSAISNTASPQTFKIISKGQIRSGALADVWSIDQDKALVNAQIGF